MFPFSSFKKENLRSELTQISVGKYDLQLNFEEISAVVTGDLKVRHKNQNTFYHSESYLDSDFKAIFSLIGLNLLRIEEFNKTEEYPYGYIVFYFEQEFEVLIKFSYTYESLILTFQQGGENHDSIF